MLLLLAAIPAGVAEAASSNASLSSLVPSVGSLSPAFSSGTTSYTDGVPVSTSSISFTPVTADSNATVAINGVSVVSGAASAAISLNAGANIINTVVTAPDGVTTETYSVVVLAGPLLASFSSSSSVPLTVSGFTATGATVSLALGYAPTTGAALTVVNNTGRGFINGTFGNLAQGQAVALTYNGSAYNFVANYYGGTGNDLVLQWAGIAGFGWGDDYYGEVGDGSANGADYTPAAVVMSGILAGKSILAVAVGSEHTLALCSDGTLAAWGYNYYGQLGNGSTTSSSVPVSVITSGAALTGKSIVAIAAGAYHSLALCSDGTLASWGYDGNGELGNGSANNSSTPIAVTTAGTVLAGKTVSSIAVGADHNLVLCTDGTLAAWGYNYFGQLGNNSTANSSLPVAVTPSGAPLAGRTVVSIAAGGEHNVVGCSDGTLVAWGDNGIGEVGDGSYVNRLVPVAVQIAGTALAGKTVTSISAGSAHSVAVCSDGTVATWGSGGYGQLGNGSTNSGTSSSLATAVVAGSLSAGDVYAAVRSGPGANYNIGIAALPLIPAPTVATAAASAITTTTAILNGTVNANNATARVSFDYGVTISYGANVPSSPSAVSGSTATPVSDVVSGLVPGTLYHFRVDGSNVTGTSYGGDLTFTTISTDASLAGLALTAGNLSPAFSSTVASYSASVPNTVSTIAVTPVANNAHATITVNGAATVSGSASGGINLGVGANTINVAVTAQDGVTKQTYTMVVTRAANATLSNLTVSAGTLTPVFSSTTISYTDSVSTSTASISITPTAADPNASVTVNGVGVLFGASSSPIELSPGANVVSLVVTGSDGTSMQTYSVVVLQGALLASLNSASTAPLTVREFTATGATINLSLNYAPVIGASLTLVNNTGLGFIHGTFSNLAQGQAVSLTYNGFTYNFVANYYGGTGNDLVLQWAGTLGYDWGDNTSGQIGNGSSGNSLVPAAVSTAGVLAGKTVVQIAIGAYHKLALCSDGTLAAWGQNYTGELGYANSSISGSSVPIVVPTSGTALAGKLVVAVAAGDGFNLALCSDGTLAAWGSNDWGQFGESVIYSDPGPLAVPTTGNALAGKSVVAISAGEGHVLTLCSDGTLVAWGYNEDGELGIGSKSESAAPTAVTTVGTPFYGETPVAIAAGYYHSMALCADGSLFTWGANNDGQLGNNGTASSSVPIRVSTAGTPLSGKSITAIAAGADHNLALCSDSTLAAWGNNLSGQLGNGSTKNSLSPTAVITSGAPLAGKAIVAISGGNAHSMARCSDGTLATWGANSDGQLGDNNQTNSALPVAVSLSSIPTGAGLVTAVSGPTSVGTAALFTAPLLAPPAVTTLAPASISSSAATLNGLVNANGSSTAVSFDYGTTTAYGGHVGGAPASVPGNTSAAVSATVTGLTPNTTYHFRVDGVNGAGASSGGDLSFATPNNNAGLANLALGAGPLSPSFSGGVTSYTVTAPSTVTSTTVTATTVDPAATVQINGAPVASGAATSPIDLSFGANSITTVVTAQNRVTTMTYTTTVIVQYSLDDWRQMFFGSTSNSGDTSALGDFNHNGIPNLLKYAFGLNPTLPSLVQLPTPGVSNGSFVVSFAEPPGVTGVSYGAECSGDLGSESWSTVPDSGSGGLHIFSVPMAGNNALFVRLVVTQQ